MAVEERVRTVVEPLLASFDVELVDVELSGSGGARILRLAVDREDGIGLDDIAEVSRAVSPALDEADLVPGRYTLEVSSPGVERALRTPAHFRRVLGETVSVKTYEPVHEARKHKGTLLTVDDEGITVDVDGDERHLRFDQVSKARTVFEWGAAPKPGTGKRARAR